MELVVGVLIGLAAGAVGAVLLTRLVLARRLATAAHEQRRLTEDARRAADAIRREAQIEAREHAVKVRGEVEQELRDRRSEIIKIEERVLPKEEEIDRKLTEFERREQSFADRETHLKQLQEELKATTEAQLKELERLSGLTVEEAKRQVLERSEELVRHELARMVRQLEEEARSDAKRRARNLVADALQRVAASHAAETTVSLVELPSDDMKGRIIGREGRNIRALENLTGVDFIIDDTPQAVVLSSFDGVRREVAKLTLAKLVEDGRIHPSRIEETYYQSKAVLVIAADAISASRPGARGESLESYIKRLETLEKIAAQKKGVERVFALQAGREIRVMVKPTEIDDDTAVLLSHEIARDIEEQLEYPGQIKVTVIRESRAVEFAK